MPGSPRLENSALGEPAQRTHGVGPCAQTLQTIVGSSTHRCAGFSRTATPAVELREHPSEGGQASSAHRLALQNAPVRPEFAQFCRSLLLRASRGAALARSPASMLCARSTSDFGAGTVGQRSEETGAGHPWTRRTGRTRKRDLFSVARRDQVRPSLQGRVPGGGSPRSLIRSLRIGGRRGGEGGEYRVPMSKQPQHETPSLALLLLCRAQYAVHRAMFCRPKLRVDDVLHHGHIDGRFCRRSDDELDLRPFQRRAPIRNCRSTRAHLTARPPAMAALATTHGGPLEFYRVSYFDRAEGWVVIWAENKVQAETHCIEIERRLAPRKVTAATHRFVVHPTAADLARFLTAHCRPPGTDIPGGDG